MVCVNSELKRLVPICYSSERTKYIVLASSVQVIGPDEQTRIDEAHKYTTTQAQKFTTKMHVSQWRSLAQMSGGQHAAGTVSNTQIRNQVGTEIHNKNIYKYKHACLRMKVIGPDERGATGGWLRANESFRCQSKLSRRGISSAFFIIWSSVPFLLYPFPLFEHLCQFSLFCHYLISCAFFVLSYCRYFTSSIFWLSLISLVPFCISSVILARCHFWPYSKKYYCGNYVERAHMFYHEHLL